MENEKSQHDLNSTEKSLENISSMGGPDPEDTGKFENVEPHVELSLFSIPNKDTPRNERIKFFICWPLFFLLRFTVPNCKNPKWQKYLHIYTYLLLLLFISIF